MMKTNTLLDINISFIQELVAKNGPDITDYEKLNEWFNKVGKVRANNKLSKSDIDSLRRQFGSAYACMDCLLGLAYTKPYGYAGDFELLDKIYTHYVSQNESLKKCDFWIHSLPATQAVRNRKSYFKQLLNSKIQANTPLTVLNLASGSCRDILEFQEENPSNEIEFDCLEYDRNAIDYAKTILYQYQKNVRFINKNVIKFDTPKQYDLVWSAGLFDYFDDKTFVRLIQRFKKNIKVGGELIIGNFHPQNPTIHIMEFSDWFLHHRDENQLITLMEEAGCSKEQITIEQEAQGVNLFVRVKF